MHKQFIPIILFLVIAVSGLSNNSKDPKKVPKESTLGIVWNYGTGENETGGLDMHMTSPLEPGEYLDFRVLSGKCSYIAIQLAGKYGGWATIYQGPPVKLSYENLFKRHYENRDRGGSILISVNGSHKSYKPIGCVLEVLLTSMILPDRSDYQVTPEAIEPEYFNPYKGIAMDGISTLEFKFSMPANKRIIIQSPRFGSLSDTDGKMLSRHQDDNPGTISLPVEPNGTARVVYHPPAYIDQNEWNAYARANRQYKDYGSDVGFYYSPDYLIMKLFYKFVIPDGTVISDSVDFRLYRPSLIFVHGFLGGGDTWEYMSDKFKDYGFVTFNAEYYRGADQTIDDQSVQLAIYIAKELDHQKQSGIKSKVVDIIAHSMGGLIARNFLYNAELNSEKHVRKLITVGTPHHGVNSLGYYAGKAGSQYLSKHKGAIEQLYERSAFLSRLNRNPPKGRSGLEFEFGNIYGVPWDGITYASSAYLPGVISYKVSDTWHSTSIYPNAITNSDEVKKVLLTWLLEPIKELPLENIHMEITSGSKGLTTSYIEPIVEDTIISGPTRFPMQLRTSEGIATANGDAYINLKKGREIWGTIYLSRYSEIRIQKCSPEYMSLHMVHGRAQFNSYNKGGHFMVSLNAGNRIEGNEGKWNEIAPPVLVVGENTEFAIEKDSTIRVTGMEGNTLLIPNAGKPADIIKIHEKTSEQINANGQTSPCANPDSSWHVALVLNEPNEGASTNAAVLPADNHDVLIGMVILVITGLMVSGLIYLIIIKIKKLRNQN